MRYFLERRVCPEAGIAPPPVDRRMRWRKRRRGGRARRNTLRRQPCGVVRLALMQTSKQLNSGWLVPLAARGYPVACCCQGAFAPFTVSSSE